MRVGDLRPHAKPLGLDGRPRRQATLIRIDVRELGFRALLRLAHANGFTRREMGDETGRIVQISGHNRLGRADNLAGGL